MPEEPIRFEDQQNQFTLGTAEVVRYSTLARTTTATLYIVGGVLGGTVCILIPLVHLITTWALPLLGIFMGIRALRRHVVLYQPQGPCPHCGKPMQLPGGSIDDADWQHCPHCQAILTVLLQQVDDVGGPAPAPAAVAADNDGNDSGDGAK